MLKTLHRGFWFASGLFFLLLGIIGLLLPVVPQIPFLLAALFCFMRSSRRFKAWMEKKTWFIRLRARVQSLRKHRLKDSE